MDLGVSQVFAILNNAAINFIWFLLSKEEIVVVLGLGWGVRVITSNCSLILETTHDHKGSIGIGNKLEHLNVN